MDPDFPRRIYAKSGERQLGPKDWRFFITTAGPGYTPYPVVDGSRTYYAEELKNVRHANVVPSGEGDLNHDPTGRFAVIYNLCDNYLEEGTVVLCFKENGFWWTMDPVPRPDLLSVAAGGSVYALRQSDLSTEWSAAVLSPGRINDVAWSLMRHLAVVGITIGGSGVVAVYDRRGRLQWSDSTSSTVLSGCGWDQDLNLVVRGRTGGNHKFWKYTADGTLLWETVFSSSGSPEKPRGLALDPDGKIYAFADETINRYDADGNLEADVGAPDTGGESWLAQDVQIDATGALLVPHQLAGLPTQYRHSLIDAWDKDQHTINNSALFAPAAVNRSSSRYAFGGFSVEALLGDDPVPNLHVYDAAGDEVFSLRLNEQAANQEQLSHVWGAGWGKDGSLFVCGDTNDELYEGARNVLKLDPDGTVLASRLLGGLDDDDPLILGTLFTALDATPGRLRFPE